MGCGGDALGWIADPLGSIASELGLPVEATRVGWAPWEIGKLGTYIQNDWRAIKHLLVPDMRRDREVMTNSSTTPRRIIYGTCRVSGQIAYVESAGDQNQFLHLVVILAGHQVSGFGTVYLDDKPVSEFGSKVTYEVFDGTQTTACAQLVAASAGLWTNDHKLLGCAYIYLKLEYDETLFPTGLPIVKVVVNGKPVFDPRSGLTAWSDNPALCVRDYGMLSEEDGGMGCDDDELPDSFILAAANVCDQLVVKNSGGTEFEKRYTCNGTLEINGTPKQFLTALLQSMGGVPVYSEGVWKIYPAAYSAPEHTIDESWLNGGISFRVGTNKGERINTVTGTFVDPSDHWAAKGFPAVTSAAYIDEDDGEELAQDLTLNFTTSPTMAQRLGKIIMERSRRGMQVDYPCNYKALKIAPHDVAQINNTLLGWENNVVRIADWQFSGTGGVRLSLSQEDEAIYSWVPGDVVEVTPPPLTILPDPRVVFPPSSVLLAPRVYTYNSGTSTRVDLLVQWTAGSPGSIRYQVQYRIVGGAWSESKETYDTQLVLDSLASGNYEVQVRGVNSISAQSVWVPASTYVPNPDETVPNITGLELWGQGNNQQFTGREVVLRWNKPTPRLLGAATGPASPNQPEAWFRYYKVEVYDGNDVLRRPAEYRVTEKYVYSFEMNHQDGAGTPTRNLRFRVTAVAVWGKESAIPAYLEVSNPAPAKIASVTLTGGLNAFSVSFNPLNEPDVTTGGGYLIHLSTTPGFTPTANTLINKGPETSKYVDRLPGSDNEGLPGGTYYIRVAAHDTFGTDALNYSDEYSVTVSDMGVLDTVPPDVPTALSAATGIEQLTQTQTAYVNLSWSAPTAADIAAGDFNPDSQKGGYTVRYKPAADTFWTEQPANTNAAKITGLIPNSSYQFQVMAFDQWGNVTAWSSVLTVTTAKKTAAPSGISDVSLKVYGGLKSIWVEWTPVTDRDVAYYEILVGENGAPEIYRAYFENIAGYGDTDPTVSLYYPLSAWAAGPNLAKDPILQPSLWGVYKTFASITDPEYLGYPVYAMNTSYVNTRPFRTLSNKFVFDILGTTYVTHHVKVRVVDTSGNASAWSSVKTSDPSKVVYSDIYVGNLAAISADLGTITAGTINATANVNSGSLTTGTMKADTAILVGGATNGVEISGAGKITVREGGADRIILGLQSTGYYGLTVRNAAGQDVFKQFKDAGGTDQTIIQNLTGGTINGQVVNVTNLNASNVVSGEINVTWSGGNIRSGKTTATDTTAGFWIGNNGGTPYLHIGNATKYMQWNGTALSLRGDLNADDIGAGTLTGRTIQTAASGQRFVVSTSNNQAEFWSDRGDGTVEMICQIGINTNEITAGTVLTVGTANTNKNGIHAVTNGTNSPIVANSWGVNSGYYASAIMATGRYGYGIDARQGGFVGMVWTDLGKAPIRLRPSTSSSAPTHEAEVGALWVTSAGVLYINKGSTTWEKVGAQ